MAQLTGLRIIWTALVIFTHFGYLLLGATIFRLLEQEAESKSCDQVVIIFQQEKLNFLTNYTCLDGPAVEKFIKVIVEALESGVKPSGNSTNPSNWDFSSSFFFAETIATTISYGNLFPSTVSGQVFCVFYALCGIPLNLVCLNLLSKFINFNLGLLKCGIFLVVPLKFVEVLAVTSFLMIGSILLLVIPPLMFSYVEGWSYGEGFYCAFITFSSIGFGGYVVGTNPDKHYITIYRSLAGVWLILGLGWLAALLIKRVLGQTLAPFSAVNKDCPPAEKQEEGTAHRVI